MKYCKLVDEGGTDINLLYSLYYTLGVAIFVISSTGGFDFCLDGMLS